MNEVNKTLYIPLYGKAKVSKKNMILRDKKAEEIWEKEKFPLKGKAKSKWLTYYMAMRAKVFDDWTEMKIKEHPDAVVLHIGCGMDSRCLRVKEKAIQWCDIDFPEVIEERKKYYKSSEYYRMIGCDASKAEQLEKLPEAKEAIIILEGISMYLKNQEVVTLFEILQKKYHRVSILMDVYTVFGAKASKYKNPVNDVGVTILHGIDDPHMVTANGNIKFLKEHTMTPENLIEELNGFDKCFFRFMFAGKMTRRIYRLFEYGN